MPGSPGKLNYHAKLTLAERVLFGGLSVAQAAYMANVSRTTGYLWVGRFITEGTFGLRERSRRPHRSPRALPDDLVAKVLAVRCASGRGPLQISHQLELACSTVYLVLKRAGLNRLRLLDKVTRAPVRYEHEQAGDLLHMDIKKLWRIPPGGGRRFGLTLEGGEPISRVGKQGFGYEYLHVAIDDHSRYLYAELLPDQTSKTTVAFLDRTVAAFRARGVRIQRLLTDNGANYCSRWFCHHARLRGIKLKRTRPYRPQTNGKAERVIQTLLREWAYQRPYSGNGERVAALPAYLEEYNTRRPHTSLGRRPPVTRLPV